MYSCEYYFDLAYEILSVQLICHMFSFSTVQEQDESALQEEIAKVHMTELN